MLLANLTATAVTTESLEEGELVARARRGDAKAVAELYRRHAQAAYALALRLCAQPALAEDIVQDSFVRVMERMAQYRGEAPFVVWLKRTAAHLSIDALRARQRWQTVEFDDDVTEVRTDPALERQLDALGLLQRLKPQARAVLVLFELEGLSHDELADLFQRTPSYSKSLLSRAKRQLAQWLELEGDDTDNARGAP